VGLEPIARAYPRSTRRLPPARRPGPGPVPVARQVAPCAAVVLNAAGFVDLHPRCRTPGPGGDRHGSSPNPPRRSDQVKRAPVARAYLRSTRRLPPALRLVLLGAGAARPGLEAVVLLGADPARQGLPLPAPGGCRRLEDQDPGLEAGPPGCRCRSPRPNRARSRRLPPALTPSPGPGRSP